MSRTPEVTRKIMSAIRSTDTKPEMLLRKALWHRGLRFRVHYKALPGKPDVVFTKVKIAVFCDGDYWHGHNWAVRGLQSLEAELEGYTEYWREKILKNVRRDYENTKKLETDGWVVMRFWESDIKKDTDHCVDLIESCYHTVKNEEIMRVKRLAAKYRSAINEAREAGEFDEDFSFRKFPQGCCGDASDLLAQFLLDNGIKTYSVCGTYSDGSFEGIQSHAWLLTENKIIIDITGDQFKDNPVYGNYDKQVYVGLNDDFHRLFDVEGRNVRVSVRLAALGDMCQSRLNNLYRKIMGHIKNKTDSIDKA